MPRYHDDRAFHAFSHKFGEDLGPFHARHLYVTEYGIETLLQGRRASAGSVLRHLNFITFVSKNLLQGATNRPLVVNDQYLHIKTLKCTFPAEYADLSCSPRVPPGGASSG